MKKNNNNNVMGLILIIAGIFLAPIIIGIFMIIIGIKMMKK